jgi:hypothetical protein
VREGFSAASVPLGGSLPPTSEAAPQTQESTKCKPAKLSLQSPSAAGPVKCRPFQGPGLSSLDLPTGIFAAEYEQAALQPNCFRSGTSQFVVTSGAHSLPTCSQGQLGLFLAASGADFVDFVDGEVSGVVHWEALGQMRCRVEGREAADVSSPRYAIDQPEWGSRPAIEHASSDHQRQGCGMLSMPLLQAMETCTGSYSGPTWLYNSCRRSLWQQVWLQSRLNGPAGHSGVDVPLAMSADAASQFTLTSGTGSAPGALTANCGANVKVASGGCCQQRTVPGPKPCPFQRLTPLLDVLQLRSIPMEVPRLRAEANRLNAATGASDADERYAAALSTLPMPSVLRRNVQQHSSSCEGGRNGVSLTQ